MEDMCVVKNREGGKEYGPYPDRNVAMSTILAMVHGKQLAVPVKLDCLDMRRATCRWKLELY